MSPGENNLLPIPHHSKYKTTASMSLDKKDFQVLQTNIEQNRKPLDHWLRKRGLDEQEIQEIYQEAWLRMLQKMEADQYKNQGNPAAYYATIARNIYYEQSRQKVKTRTNPMSAQLEPYLATDETENFDRIASEASIRILYQSLQEMNPEHRLLLERRYIQDMKPRQLSKIYKLSENTINQRLWAYRKACKDIAKKKMAHQAVIEEEKIDRYLRNIMPAEEQISFEAALQEDADLWQEVKLSAALLFVLRHQDRLEIPAQVSAPTSPSSGGNIGSPISQLKPGLTLSGKAILTLFTVVCLSVVVYLYMRPKIALRSLAQIELSKNQPAFLSTTEEFRNIKNLYEAQKYQQVIDSLAAISAVDKIRCWFCDEQIAYSYLLSGRAKVAAAQFENHVDLRATAFIALPSRYYYSISLLIQGQKHEAIEELDLLMELVGKDESYIRYDTERLLQEVLRQK